MLIAISRLVIFKEIGSKASLFLVAMILVNIICINYYHYQIGKISLNLFQIAPGISISFATQDIGLIFALMVSFLWFVTHIYTGIYLNKAQTRELSLYFTIALGSVLCIAFASNLITLFIFYEVLTLATYPMIKFDKTIEAKKSAKKYLSILLGSSFLFFFPAMVINYYYAGNLDFQIDKQINLGENISLLLLVLYVFGIAKTSLMPMHSWLTSAMVAPIPVSALLHAVAVVKTGIFTFLKIITFNIGLNNINHYGCLFLVIIAAITIIIGAIMAKKQKNLKLMLAYSTISQLSYSILICATSSIDSVNAAFLQMISHGFAKIALFFGAGYFYLATNVTNIKELGAIGKKMPLVTICFTICALSIIGIPPLIGFWSKFYMLKSLYPLNDIGYIIIATMIIATLLTASYFLPVIYQFWWGEDAPKLKRNDNKIPIIIVTIMVIFMGFLFNFIKNTAS
jgi:formate hydrogenlyase subunit 3/multisubunit Na+/H+ antiporter MnhD subunit